MVSISACVALAACAAPPRWEKPGASQTAMNEDMQQCRVQSRLSPEAHTETLGPRSGLGPTGSPTTPGMDRIDDRDAREAQQFQVCMREKGYSSVR